MILNCFYSFYSSILIGCCFIKYYLMSAGASRATRAFMVLHTLVLNFSGSAGSFASSHFYIYT